MATARKMTDEHRARLIGFLLSNGVDVDKVLEDSPVIVDCVANTVTVDEHAERDGEPWFIGDYPVIETRSYPLVHPWPRR